MKVIGITGGVGSGKTAILSYLAKNYNCKVIYADEVAHEVEMPGEECYHQLKELLSDEILNPDGTIDKKKMAEKIFSKNELLGKVNQMIHPAVKKKILSHIQQEKEEQKIDVLFIEAALLIEDGYLSILDEIWYIYAKENIRRERLKASRHYSDEKIDQIMGKQLSEQEFREKCRVVIDNSGELADAYRQIDEKMGEYLWQK